MEQQHTRVPALRFPAFEGDWVEKRLGEVADGIMYGMNSSAIPYDGKNKYLRITDIDESSRTFSPNPLTSPDGLIEEKYKLKEGDIVFTRTGASVGKSYLYKNEDGNLLFAGFLIKFSIVGCDPYFVFIQTLTSKYDEWVLKMSMRSGQPGLNAEEYKDFLISLPTLPEQQKIATFFTAIDEKLRGLKEKQSLLEVYKKGVMQQLFTQQIRFKKPDGGDFEDWTVRRLGEVAESISSGKSKVKDSFGNYPIYGSTGIIGSSVSYEYSGDNILIARVGANAGSLYKVQGHYSVTDNTLILKLLKEVELDFVFYLLLYLNLNKLVFGSGQPLITGGHLKALEIPIPTLPEQTQIATYLSALDAKIAAVSAQVSALGEWKKGLLQRMFP